MCLEEENKFIDKDENLELSDEGKVFLEERMRMMANSKSNSSWKEVKIRLYEKYE